MRRLFWHSVDSIGLAMLHRQKSRASYFDGQYEEWTAVKREEFYGKPQLPIMEFKQQPWDNQSHALFQFNFKSAIDTNLTPNDTASGLIYKPDRPNGKHAVVVHGWRMGSLDRVQNLLLPGLLEAGYQVYFPCLPHHMERMQASALYSGEHMVSADLPGTLQAVRQGVSDLRALIRWIKETHDNARIALVGVSLGGFITNLTATVEEGIDDLVAVLYANSLPYSVWHTIPGKYIREDMAGHGLTYEKLCEAWSLLEPGANPPLVDRSRILLLSGRYDRYVVTKDTDALWEAWGRPRRRVFPFGHAGLAFRQQMIADEVLSFLQTRSTGEPV